MGKWYFVSKINLTYSEKKSFLWLRKTVEIRGRSAKFFNNFEIIGTVHLNSERSEQFLKEDVFLAYYWRFLISLWMVRKVHILFSSNQIKLKLLIFLTTIEPNTKVGNVHKGCPIFFAMLGYTYLPQVSWK